MRYLNFNVKLKAMQMNVVAYGIFLHSRNAKETVKLIL